MRISVLLKHHHNFGWLRLCALLLACVLALLGAGPSLAAALPPAASTPLVTAVAPGAVPPSALPACCRSGHCHMRCCLGKTSYTAPTGAACRMAISCRCAAPVPDAVSGGVLPLFLLPNPALAPATQFAPISHAARSQIAASHRISPAPRPPCRLVTGTL